MIARSESVTVQVSVWFEEMPTSSRIEAERIVLDIIRAASRDCKQQIMDGLKRAGAQSISVHMLTY